MKVERRTISREEARRFPRVARTIRVHARLAKRKQFDQHTETLNVGLGGVCINTYRDLPVGAPIELTFKDIGPDQTFDAKGRVAWSRRDPDGSAFHTGIEILGLQRTVLEHLLTIISAGAWTPGPESAPHCFHLRRHLGLQYRPTRARLLRSWRNAYTDQLSLRDLIMYTENEVTTKGRMELRVLLPDGQEGPLQCSAKATQVRPGGRKNHWMSTVRFEDMPESSVVRLAIHLSREFLPPEVLPNKR